MSVSFSTIADALAANNLPVRLYCRIGGVAVDITDARTSHSVDAAIGRCTVTIPAPRPATLELMAEIEVEAGYPGQVHRIFHGVIPDYGLAIDDRGSEFRVTGVGWSYYLTDPDETGLTFDGPVSLKEIFRGTCEWRTVPTYYSEETYLPDGTALMLGGNEQVDAGDVIIDARTSPRSFLDRAAGLFGYRTYDRPDGAFVQSRVSGLPPVSGTAQASETWATGDTAILTSEQVLFAGGTLSAALPVGELTAGAQVQIIAPQIAQPGLDNGTFAATIDGWQQRWNPDGFVYTASRDAAVFADAAGSLKIAITDVPNIGNLLVYGIQDEYRLPAMPGVTYAWDAQIRKDHATDLKPVIRLEFFDEGGAYITSYEDEIPNTANTWFSCTVSGPAPANTRWQMITLGIYTNVSSVGATRSVWIDAITPSASSPPWIEVSHDTLGTGWVHPDALGVPTPAWTLQEGVDCFKLDQQNDVRPMRTYWVVEGASYDDADGVPVQIRSTAETVEGSDYLPPLGYRKATLSDKLLTTATLADGCRNVMEIDYAAPSVTESFEIVGNPLLMPGSVALIISSSMDVLGQLRWVMSVDHDIDDRGFITTIETWAGNGEALPAGDDCISESIGSADAYHLGNETLSWYRDPSPDGESVTINITVADVDYSSLALSGIAHGTNSYKTNTASTGSVVEVWQLPDPTMPATGDNEIRRVGSVELPTLDEEIKKRRPYGPTDTYWTPFRLPMPGSLKAGAAEIRLISGDNTDGDDVPDDYEVTDLMLTYCGVGVPTLPGQGGTP